MIHLDGDSLTLEKFKKIVSGNEKVGLSEQAIKKIRASRLIIEKAVKSGEKVYSINTGFGFLSKVTIPAAQLEELQINLIRSHASGLGDPHTETESRAILLLRTNVLAKGFSGVRLELVEFLVSLLNQRVHPVIPSKGSVGASGDLAPLAHLAAVVLGEGEAFVQGVRMPGLDALKKVGLSPLKLAPKEGLSLINGTQQMTALGALCLLKAEELIDLSDLITSASLDGILGTGKAFAAWVQDTRPYPGQKRTAELIRNFMSGSDILKSHEGCDRVQDPYSFRCAPQVHGASRELLRFVRETLSIELNAATDNPLVNSDTGEIISQGNFHGQPVAFALDILGMALSEISSLSERRIAKLIDPQFSSLPAFLVKNEGVNSGFMIPHVAAASLVSENKLLTHPASTDSIPTSNEKEDHVSMGPIAARKANTILKNTTHVLAIEALAACQALDLRKPLKPGKGPAFLLKLIREKVSSVEKDRYFHKDIQTVSELIESGSIYQQGEKENLWQ
ncbi:MAG: histidine ammonia-lyase [Proteobacteria bacterium]|nr:histidine ammonia-lyase [Pseudomonadota bacterium]NDC22972.1 histidine ammonia-lyase [Pseudomonadota bacterium]NDD03429.1 histidine ammonia-lyase [Pseudomonadota bacterium]NDG25557.1 histidine ammonia-lyase [Pseudomonadota bacterium]